MDSDKRMDGHSFSDRNSSKNRQQIRGGRETRPKGTEVTHVTISSPSHLFGMSSTSAHMVRMDGNYYESLHRNPGTGNKKVGQPEEVDNLISMEFLRQVSTHMCGLPKNTHVVQQHTMHKTFFPLQNSIIIANKSSFSEYVGHSPAAAVLFAEIIKFAVSLFQNAVLAKLAKLCLPIVVILLCNRSMLTKKFIVGAMNVNLYFNLWLH